MSRQINVPDEVYNHVKKLAHMQNKSMAEVTRVLILRISPYSSVAQTLPHTEPFTMLKDILLHYHAASHLKDTFNEILEVTVASMADIRRDDA